MERWLHHRSVASLHILPKKPCFHLSKDPHWWGMCIFCLIVKADFHLWFSAWWDFSSFFWLQSTPFLVLERGKNLPKSCCPLSYLQNKCWVLHFHKSSFAGLRVLGVPRDSLSPYKRCLSIYGYPELCSRRLLYRGMTTLHPCLYREGVVVETIQWNNLFLPQRICRSSWESPKLIFLTFCSLISSLLFFPFPFNYGSSVAAFEPVLTFKSGFLSYS